MNRRNALKWMAGAGLYAMMGPACTKSIFEDGKKPNIVLFYADDIGYGDIGCYGAHGVRTPNLDRLASGGVRFTDAHCSSATCTPSRYSLLTGSYAFRRNAQVLQGNAPLLISLETPTLPAILQKAGYRTGVVGKWHLGLGDGDLDWNGKISPGPLEIGFDYSFLIPATGDRVPCVYVENHSVVNADPADPIRISYRKPIGDVPTGESHPQLLRMKADGQHSKTIINGISRIGYMEGGEKALWKDEEFPFVLTEKCEHFIQENRENPFFLYYSFHDIHVPRVTHPDFVGKSTMGPRGDAIAQVDYCVGRIMKTLEEHNLMENTLVLFTSDNGPVLDDGYEDRAVEMLGDHKPAGPFRGGKYSAFEAGTRMPTIAFWPSKINPGVNDALWGQIDLFASLAALTGQTLNPNASPDGENMLDVLLNRSDRGRDYLLEESHTLSLRYKHWKYIRPSKPIAWIDKGKKIESGQSIGDQLYDLSTDIGEQTRLSEKLNEIAGSERGRK